MMMISTSVVSSWFTPTTLFCFINLIIVTIFLISRWKKPDPHPQIGRVDSLRAIATGPSILQRVKSIDFSSSFQRFNQYSNSAFGSASASSVSSSSSSTSSVDTHSAAHDSTIKAKTVVVETSSNRVRGGNSSNRERWREDEEGVNEKADDFINRFRQQLKLQRLDSILRYKDMLNRGVGGGQ